jgi:hypothetical protein
MTNNTVTNNHTYKEIPVFKLANVLKPEDLDQAAKILKAELKDAAKTGAVILNGNVDYLGCFRCEE